MYKSKIFLVGSDNDSLIELEETDYVTENVLQEFLARYPDLLPGDQIDLETPRRWLLVAREMSVPGDENEAGRWSLDHLFLDQDGIPTFVECKRASDTRIRREVVAQMLDYAANGLEYWSIDKLRQVASETAQKEGNSLDDAIVTLLDGGEDLLDIEEYWDQVELNLRQRMVRLVFVADSIPRELRRLVEFLNDEMANVEVLAVEIKQFQRSDFQGDKALVPRVVGLTERARTEKGASSGARKTWTEEQYFSALSEHVEPYEVEIVRDLYEWARRTADRLWLRTGAEKDSFTFHYLKNGKTVSVFYIYTDGEMVLNYGTMFNQVDHQTLEKFHERISQIPTFSQIPADFSKRPSVRIKEIFSESTALDQFKNAVLWLQDELSAG